MSDDLLLDPTEARIIGVLIEKSLTTPENYPLSINALVNGCNQKSNRFPVTNYVDFAVEGALRSLYQRHWATMVDGLGRVTKWKHRADDQLGLSVEEKAVMAELLLRGAQQPGELRARSARMAPGIKTQSELNEVLEGLEARSFPLVAHLPTRVGERVARWDHRLYAEAPTEASEIKDSAEPVSAQSPEVAASSTPPGTQAIDLVEQVTALNHRVAELERRVQAIEQAKSQSEEA